MEGEQKSVEEKNEDKTFRKLINVAVVIMLVGLIFIALYTFFFNMNDAISTLFEYRYVALIKSIFSLVVLGICIFLVKMFLSR